jgi:hypothetical protein
MKIIYNFIDKINYNLGLLLFKNSNLFSLNLYKYFYKKNICNLNLLSNGFINSYYQNGYSKLGSASPNHIEELKHLLSLQKPTINEEYLFHYKITPEIYEIIKKILNNDLKKKLNLIEKYYNNKLFLAFLTISRNYPSQKIEESYSNFFHTDGYVYNMFKIFINLHDVNEENGPLTLVKKEYATDFLKKFKYKNRDAYQKSEKENSDIFYKNIGKSGEMFLCSTTELIHRAGDPASEHHRDMVFLNFVASPTYQKDLSLLQYQDKLYNDSLIKKLSKIKGLKNLISFYKKNLKEKLI